jgi:O-antigen ligase
VNLIILLVFFVLSATFHQPLYLIIPFLACYYFSANTKAKLPLNRLSKLYISLFLVIVSFFLIQSVLNFSIKIYSIKGALRYLTYASFILLIFNFNILTIKKFFDYLIIFFAFCFPFAVYQLMEIGRYQHFFSHANHLAHVLVVLIYYLWVYKPFTKRTRRILQFTTLASLILTKTTGAILILFILLGYKFIVTDKIPFMRKLIIAFVALVAIPYGLSFSDKIMYQIHSLDYLNWEWIMYRVEHFKTGGYGSFIWRIIYWTKILISFFSESLHKIIFGVGVDALTKGNMPYEYLYTDPHNDFLKVLVEFGILGLLLLFYFFKNLYYALNRNFYFIIMISIPMFFDNVIVSFPFNLVLMLLFVYDFKTHKATTT